ncbi:MAG: hypothetical protein HY607_05365 [Planctomycetes bacterium]|nr:hypothetical protein [Planctomycetota bacterium]
MEEISSIAEDVSSIEAACCEAPSARLWLDSEICPDAEATCEEPSVRSASNLLKRPEILPVIFRTIHPSPTTKSTAATPTIKFHFFKEAAARKASFLSISAMIAHIVTF